MLWDNFHFPCPDFDYLMQLKKRSRDISIDRIFEIYDYLGKKGCEETKALHCLSLLFWLVLDVFP